MNYLLDTNICIYLIKTKPPAVLQHFKTLAPTQVCISSITVFELLFGVENSQSPQRNREALDMFLKPMNIIDFTADDAKHAARIRAELKKQGTPIGAYDLQIAAIALNHNFTLVTNNTAEFVRVTGLVLENWV